MDADRFDALSRTFAAPSSRRKAVGALGVGGLLGALFGRPIRAIAAEKTCELQITLKPSENSGSPAMAGKLTLQIGEEGSIDDGLLATDDGDEFDVVGQATGRAISLFVDLGGGDALALTGIGEREVVLCRGTFAGSFGGPQPGDIGSWTAGRERSESGGSGSGSSSGNSGGSGSSSGSGSSGGGSSSGSGGSSGSGNSSGGNSNCPSGVVCNGVCCTPRVGFTPDSITCDSGFCACTYSCAAAGCENGGTENSFTIGCDDRPNALCGENCNFPTDNGCGDMTCDEGEELDVDSCTCVSADGGGGVDERPDADPDGDGLTNAEESNIGTIPTAWDSDGDTINDGEEVNQTGTDPMNRDSDGDLHNDNEEITSGTDPWDPNSHL